MSDISTMRAAAAGFQESNAAAAAEATVNKIMDVQAQQNENEAKRIDASILMHRASIAKFLVKHADMSVDGTARHEAIRFLVELMKGEPV